MERAKVIDVDMFHFLYTIMVYVFMGAGDIQTYEYSFERLLSNLTSNVQ